MSLRSPCCHFDGAEPRMWLKYAQHACVCVCICLMSFTCKRPCQCFWGPQCVFTYLLFFQFEVAFKIKACDSSKGQQSLRWDLDKLWPVWDIWCKHQRFEIAFEVFFSLVSHSLVLHLSERFEGWLSNLSPSPETFGESCSAESEGTELRKLKYWG